MKPLTQNFRPFDPSHLSAIRLHREKVLSGEISTPKKKKKKTPRKKKKVELTSSARDVLEGLDPDTAAFLKSALEGN